jgi:hypothetical protein
MQSQRFLRAVLLSSFTVSVLAMMLPRTAIGQIAAAAAPRGGCTSSNVTTTVSDFDASGALLMMRSDDYNAAGQATYTSVGSCGSTLLSGIVSGGGWRLELFNQTVRKLWITPDSPINGSQPIGPAAGYYSQKVEAYSRCFDLSSNEVPFQNLTNGSDNCSLGVDFQTGGTKGTKYKLVMGPKLPASTTPAPATGLTSVACNSVINSQCVNWTISPNTAAANTGVANLYSYNAKGALVFIGQYYNTFLINATNP